MTVRTSSATWIAPLSLEHTAPALPAALGRVATSPNRVPPQTC